MDSFYYEDYENGIYALDVQYQRPRFAACYLVVQGDQAAFIDTGTANAVPQALELMRRLGIAPDMVKYVMPTHVHLDHAGGAGRMMALFPEAQLVVHPRGARHLIDPTRLQASATEVYGAQRFGELFGTIEPVAEGRVVAIDDDYRIDLNGRELVCFDTPGHANHHYCVYDAAGEGFFTGDTFGLCYPELADHGGSFIFASTTPTQFDPDTWRTTLDRLMEEQPRYLYVTHFGRVEERGELAEALRRDLDAHVEIAFAAPQEGRLAWLQQRLMEHLKERLAQRGGGYDSAMVERLLQADVALNAQGLVAWLERLARRGVEG